MRKYLPHVPPLFLSFSLCWLILLFLFTPLFAAYLTLCVLFIPQLRTSLILCQWFLLFSLCGQVNPLILCLSRIYVFSSRSNKRVLSTSWWIVHYDRRRKKRRKRALAYQTSFIFYDSEEVYGDLRLRSIGVFSFVRWTEERDSFLTLSRVTLCLQLKIFSHSTWKNVGWWQRSN